MFTELKIKRICNSFKAPDIEIPLLSAKAAKRPRLKPVLATAALALVIVGASVIGIKGNIFKGEQPLPPVDTDTPDTPDTPTPPDTDTPTPPEDDVKIIYADSEPSIGFGMDGGELLPGELWIAVDFEKVLNSNESKDSKFAVYLLVNWNQNEFLLENDERYRILNDIRYDFAMMINRMSFLVKSNADKYLELFMEYKQDLIADICEYEKTFGGGSDDIYFNEKELEIVNKVVSMSEEELKGEEKLREIYSISSQVSIEFRNRLNDYKAAKCLECANDVMEKDLGVPLKVASEEKLRKLGVAELYGNVFEADLTKEEIYSLEEKKHRIDVYRIAVYGRSENVEFNVGFDLGADE